jgi:hypothetical protein
MEMPFIRKKSRKQRLQYNGFQKQRIAGNRFYSPLVLNIASEGVSMTELETIPGNGNEGRVTKKDILEYIRIRNQISNILVAPLLNLR